MESVARTTEISARSEESFEDAVRIGIERATQSLRNVRGAWVKEQEVKIQDDRIVAFQVIMKVTFELDK
ncbi:MAG: dodecin family protein [Nitriliruptoraceae bacterium]